MSTADPRGRALVIPAATIERVLTPLLTAGRVERGWLGLALHPVALPEAITAEGGQGRALMVGGRGVRMSRHAAQGKEHRMPAFGGNGGKDSRVSDHFDLLRLSHLCDLPQQQSTFLKAVISSRSSENGCEVESETVHTHVQPEAHNVPHLV